MRVLATVIVLAACARPTSEPRPAARHTAASRASGPAPAIEFAWHESLFVTHHLPAIAASGELAVIALRDTDGGRGFPNLALELRDRRDALVRRIEILAASDYERLAPDGKPGPELERRIRDANRELEALHAEHALAAMAALENTPALAVTWSDPRLVVRSRGTELRTVDGTRWRAPAGVRCAQCEPCSNPAFLAGAFKAPGLDVIVVEIGYQGTDTCWEPGPQFHVVAW